MNEVENQHLQKLLTAFDVNALGEGDESVGFNLLTAMAVTLANLAHPSTCIQTPEMRSIRVGCNLLASGSRLTNMILDEVVNPVGVCQDNILQHVDKLSKADEEQHHRPLQSFGREWNFPKISSTNSGEGSFFNLMTADSKTRLLLETNDEFWLNVVEMAPSKNFMDLVRRPRAFIVAASPAMLSSQLGSIHAGQALITISLNRASDVGRFGNVCEALMNGALPFGPSGEINKGKLLITDLGNVLPEAAREGAENSSWLRRLLWLVSGNEGVQPQKAVEGNVVRLPFVASRFKLAAQRIFANRMNSSGHEKLSFEIDLTKAQSRWMVFLQSMESSLPGISSTARHLLASLIFGLRRIVGALDTPDGFKYSINGIEALAGLLVERMAIARAEIVFSAEEAQKQRRKQRILMKLSEGSLDLRSIYHPLHLSAADCETFLLELEAEYLVKRRGKKWECIEGVTVPGNRYLRQAMKE